jgi:hypothetical protein
MAKEPVAIAIHPRVPAQGYIGFVVFNFDANKPLNDSDRRVIAEICDEASEAIESGELGPMRGRFFWRNPIPINRSQIQEGIWDNFSLWSDGKYTVSLRDAKTPSLH